VINYFKRLWQFHKILAKLVNPTWSVCDARCDVFAVIQNLQKTHILAGSEKRTQEDQLPTQWRAQLTVWETVY